MSKSKSIGKTFMEHLTRKIEPVASAKSKPNLFLRDLQKARRMNPPETITIHRLEANGGTYSVQTASSIVNGEGLLRHIVSGLIYNSQWVLVEPMSDDLWRVTVKLESARFLHVPK